MNHILPINHRDHLVALELHAILQLAYEQEAKLDSKARLEEFEETVVEIQKEDGYFLGAFDEGKVVGYLSIAPDDEAEQLAIDTLVVSPTHQRRGIGSQLLQEALKRGAGMTFSVVTAAVNAPALRLYQNAGFLQYRQGRVDQRNLAMVKLRRSAL